MKSYYFNTDWRYYRKYLIGGLLTLPLFGLGLIPLLYVFFQLNHARFEITPYDVIHGKQSIPLTAVNSVQITDFRVLRSGNIATITVKSDKRTITLKGIRGATKAQHIIEVAIEALKKENQPEKSTESMQSTAPGQLEQLNDLVGLWQQGLLSDDQFHEEKSKFNNI